MNHSLFIHSPTEGRFGVCFSHIIKFTGRQPFCLSIPPSWLSFLQLKAVCSSSRSNVCRPRRNKKGKPKGQRAKGLLPVRILLFNLGKQSPPEGYLIFVALSRTLSGHLYLQGRLGNQTLQLFFFPSLWQKMVLWVQLCPLNQGLESFRMQLYLEIGNYFYL